ncbi:MAG: nucleotidyltransferase, partial [Bacteroidetes bacterium]|nr:nucleotidyltransferase [Bacteroidota bacterium]
EEVENQLLEIAAEIGSKGKIYYQDLPLGTAHAVLCAKESLKGKVVVAFADTLFSADFELDAKKDGIVWVHKVKDPAAFGVVKTDKDGVITGFIEKPKEFVSDLAIIGIYYFRDGENFCNELQYLIDNDIRKGTEYQLTDALENMKNKGFRFSIGQVKEWLDCGNKNAAVETNKRMLEIHSADQLVHPSVKLFDSLVLQPCFIGENVEITHSIIGPHVSIGKNTKIKHSIITNSIIQSETVIENANIDNSMAGSYVDYHGELIELSIGDYTSLTKNTQH